MAEKERLKRSYEELHEDTPPPSLGDYCSDMPKGKMSAEEFKKVSREFVKEAVNARRSHRDYWLTLAKAGAAMESAGRILEEEGKYGAAEKCYDKSLRYFGSKNIWATNEWAKKDILERNGGVREKRLLKIGKYLGRRESRKLEKTVETVAIIGLFGGIFFLSSNITGNAIANMTNSSSNILGAGLLIVGLVAGFFWMKSRR